MIPAIYNIEMEQGSTYDRVFRVSDSTLDLTNYDSIRMQIRQIPGSRVVWDSEATTPGGSITIVDKDNLRVTIDSDTTKAFKFDAASYDIELVIDGTPEVVDKLLKGKIVLNKEITK